MTSTKTRPTSSPDSDRTAVERTWRHKTLLTPAELSFLHVLTRVVQGRCLIVAKARLADLFGLRRDEESSPAFERIDCKHIDFVLCDPRTSEMLAAIEIDDSRHDRSERNRLMDRLFIWNHLPLIRVPSSFIYAPEKLGRELAKVLGEGRLQAIGN